MEVEEEGLHGGCTLGAGCWGTKKTLWCRCDRVRAVQVDSHMGRELLEVSATKLAAFMAR